MHRKVITKTERNILYVSLFTCFSSHDQLPDGATTLMVDDDAVPNPILYVGGNCTIQGFDHHGNDVFWTVRKYILYNG